MRRLPELVDQRERRGQRWDVEPFLPDPAALARLGKPLGPGVVVCLTAEAVPVDRNITALPVGAL